MLRHPCKPVPLSTWEFTYWDDDYGWGASAKYTWESPPCKDYEDARLLFLEAAKNTGILYLNWRSKEKLAPEDRS